MRKLLLLLLFSLFAGCDSGSSIYFTDEEKAYIENHPAIVYAAETQRAPYSFLDEGGNIRGISQDYISLIAAKTGLKFQAHLYDEYSTAQDALRARKIDVLPSTRGTEGRDSYLIYTDPYVSTIGIRIMRTDHKDPPKTVAIATGAAIKSWIPEAYPTLKISEYPNRLAMLRAVSKGEIDCAIMDSISFQWFKPLVDEPLVYKEIPFDYPYRFAALKNNTILISIMNKAVRYVTPTEVKAIELRWKK